MLIEVKISGLIIDPNSSSPIVILKGVKDDGVVPIWVGSSEANAIALEIEKIVPERPLTHDLLKSFLIQCKYKISRIVINDLSNNTYFSIIEIIKTDGEKIFIDSRPSDAIALALRMDAPIYITKRVMDISLFTTKNAGSKSTATKPDKDEWPDIIG